MTRRRTAGTIAESTAAYSIISKPAGLGEPIQHYRKVGADVNSELKSLLSQLDSTFDLTRIGPNKRKKTYGGTKVCIRYATRTILADIIGP